MLLSFIFLSVLQQQTSSCHVYILDLTLLGLTCLNLLRILECASNCATAAYCSSAVHLQVFKVFFAQNSLASLGFDFAHCPCCCCDWKIINFKFIQASILFYFFSSFFLLNNSVVLQVLLLFMQSALIVFQVLFLKTLVSRFFSYHTAMTFIISFFFFSF